jgi:hypothetical protein
MLRRITSFPALALLLASTLPACGSSSDEPAQETSSGDESQADEGADGQGESGTDSTGETGQEPLDPVQLIMFEGVTFYDGYAEKVDHPVPEGTVRLRNDLFTTKFTQEELDSIQNTLTLDVYVQALCDNYDRLGHVYLAFVPEGSETYDPAEVTRFEIARLVTPFMNMNLEPTIVPFQWDVSDAIALLKDPALLEGNEVWLELSVFGVPYAANTEINGCEGRNDTSNGYLSLTTDQTADAPNFDTTIPIAVNEAFNNYNENATDAVGTTRKTRTFTLDSDKEEVQLVLITSNHGANAGGEEYNRREHYVGVDGELVHQYKPGRDTCEPFRMWNTQANGIYGNVPKTPEEWQSFSNWCPGDVIDIRTIELGAMTAGEHEFVLEVPDAVFAEGQGNIPFSLYVQAR